MVSACVHHAIASQHTHNNEVSTGQRDAGGGGGGRHCANEQAPLKEQHHSPRCPPRPDGPSDPEITPSSSSVPLMPTSSADASPAYERPDEPLRRRSAMMEGLAEGLRLGWDRDCDDCTRGMRRGLQHHRKDESMREKKTGNAGHTQCAPFVNKQHGYRGHPHSAHNDRIKPHVPRICVSFAK